jgi:hypothetical protein
MKGFQIILFFLTFLCAHIIFAQDSLLIETSLTNELKGQHNLYEFTNRNIQDINIKGQNIPDNPMYHFAIYNGLTLQTKINKKYHLETGIFMEERSFSGGSNTVKNWVFFPKITFTVRDTLNIGKQTIRLYGKGGDFWAEDMSDIIRFYNIDFQASDIRIGYKSFDFGLAVIGDLSRNIGLGLTELYKFYTQYKTPKFKNVSSISINELAVSNSIGHHEKYDYNVGNYFKYDFDTSNSLEAQIDFRVNKTLSASKAFAIKYSSNLHTNFRFQTTVRYFDSQYNQGYATFGPRFRDGSSYVGLQLYPLKNFYRPMNQWALMTEQQGTDVLNVELCLKTQKNLSSKIAFFANLEFNLVYRFTGKKPIYYPLYESGFSYTFFKNFIYSISVTNKQMNLDSFYQTFYLSRRPMLSYNVTFNLNDIKIQSQNVKL